MEIVSKRSFFDKFSKDHPCLYWYISPVTDQSRYSSTTALYQLLNFTLALAIFIVDVTLLSVSLGLTALFCIGLILLWVSFEIVFLFAEIDLIMAYFLVEDNKDIKPIKPLSLQLRLILLHIPKCSEFFARVKFLYTSWPIYVMIFYQILIKPIITLLTSWTVIFVFYWLGMISFPIWYAIDSHTFQNNQMCIFGGTGNCDNDGNNCTCYGWNINNLGNCFAACILAIITLPLILKLNNHSAKLSKMVTYFFFNSLL